MKAKETKKKLSSLASALIPLAMVAGFAFPIASA